MVPIRLPRRHRKGASMAEYALLVALLGGTAATMVFVFSQTFIANFEEATNYHKNAFTYAETDGVGRLTLSAFAPPGAATGAPFSTNLSTLLVSKGFFSETETPVWSALDLPPGLTINAATGVVSGTPTVAGTYPARITVDQGEASVDAIYTFVVS